MPTKITPVRVERETFHCPHAHADPLVSVGHKYSAKAKCNVYLYECMTCGYTEESAIEYPRTLYRPIEVGKPEVTPPSSPPPPWVSPQAYDAIRNLIMEKLDEYTPATWSLDWSNSFEKFIPVYNHASGQWSLRGTRHQQFAPSELFRTKTAWDAVIRSYPDELKIFMGILS